MSREYVAVEAHEHGLHNDEFHDGHLEHSHEAHVCSSTCEHHQAMQHIDFMELAEHHDHSPGHGEEHVHGPACGHVEFEQALFQVDQGKEKNHFHDSQEEHVHGPNCGHVKYQLAHTEIDKPHTHDEHCGHLLHHEAVDHVDHGIEQKPNGHPEYANHNHEEEHVHGPTCGHIEYEEAYKQVDKHTDEPATVKDTVDHGAGNAEESSQVDGHHIEATATTRQVEIDADTAAGALNAATSQNVSGSTEVASEVNAVSPAPSETSNASRPDKAAIARLHEAAATSVGEIRTEDEPTNPASETVGRTHSVEQLPIEVLDTDAIAPTDEFEPINPGNESDDSLQLEMPLAFIDEGPRLELASEPLSSNEPLEAGDDTLNDFAPSEVGDTLESTHAPDTPAFDFAEGQATDDISTDFDAYEGPPSLQLVEGSALESLAGIPGDESATGELESITNFTSGESTFDFSNFDNGQMPEIYNVAWPASAKISEDELESRLDTARTYLKSLMDQAGGIDPTDLDAASDRLLAMLQDLPKESTEELLPLLEELTELYDLPKLERLLELYFAGHYQDQGMFTRLFGSSSQNDQGASIKFGEAVLRILGRAGKKVRVEAA